MARKIQMRVNDAATRREGLFSVGAVIGVDIGRDGRRADQRPIRLDALVRAAPRMVKGADAKGALEAVVPMPPGAAASRRLLRARSAPPRSPASRCPWRRDVGVRAGALGSR